MFDNIKKLLFSVLTTLLTFRNKLITSGLATCFDHGGHPQDSQLLQKCELLRFAGSCYYWTEVSSICVKLFKN